MCSLQRWACVGRDSSETTNKQTAAACSLGRWEMGDSRSDEVIVAWEVWKLC
ncbi:hypothetical protein Mapa_005967 [Marchantia paleacea]|nr:hypothetical protein Mapa_005967 [Marchantia paleacea]